MRVFKQTRPATIQDVSWLRQAMSAELEKLRLKKELVQDLAIVISEVGANLVAHSNPRPKHIDVEVDLSGNTLVIHIRDDGGTFEDFNTYAAKKEPASILDEGGRGIALIRSSLDRLRYTPGEPNIFTGWRGLAAKRPSVLVIEDTPASLDLYSSYLDLDYNVIGCASLEEARLALTTTLVDVILADFHLGDGSSSSLLEEHCGSDDLEPPPIVFLSSDLGPDVREKCLQRGAEFFIAKPVNASSLRSILNLAITRAGLRSARLSHMFARHVGALMDNLLPSEIGGYRTACIGGSATAGGGDIVIRFQAGAAERIIVADVMGHGVAARAWAIGLAATMRTLQNCKPHLKCDEFLGELARLVWQDVVLQGAIATVLVVDLTQEGVTAASAGHPSPFVLRAKPVRMNTCGPLLGIVAPVQYEADHVQLASGDRVVLFTDGIDHFDETQGDRLPIWIERILNTHTEETFDLMAADLTRSAEASLGPQPSDDWTLVVLEKK